jgi:hypothetical protein
MPYLVPHILTKIDIAALKHADYLTVRFDGSDNSKSAVSAIKRAHKTEQDPFATDQYHTISAPIMVHGYDYKPASHVTCWEMLSLYYAQGGHVESVIGTLRAGDGVRFEFYPDYHSNGYMAKAGLHGDALRLHVTRGDKRFATWELAAQGCPDNSARMCKGIGQTERYKQQAVYV